MNKPDLIAKLQAEAELTRNQSVIVVDLFFDEMAAAFSSGDRVEIRGLCSFFVRQYEAYTGRNLKTGEKVKNKPKRLPLFKAGLELKKSRMLLYDVINDIPMFEYFSDREKKKFAKMKYSMAEFKNGETIIVEGDESASMFLLIKGVCLITKKQAGTTIRLSRIETGELFGEMSFFTKGPRQTNVIANGDVIVMEMDGDFFEKMNPDIRDKIQDYFIKLLTHRLHDMNASIMKTSKLMRC